MSSVGRHDYTLAAKGLPRRPWHLLVLSAKSRAALEAATRNLVEHLQRYSDLDIADVAFTLQAGRPLFAHRRTLVCRDLKEAVAALGNPDHESVYTTQQSLKQPPVAFVFAGEAPPISAASGLYETEVVFAHEIDRLADSLIPALGLDLRRLLTPSPESGAASRAVLDDPGVSAAAVFAIEYALARSWESWGVSPAAVMGYGGGEYAAACIAGVIEPEQAAVLAAARGRVLSGDLEQAAFAKATKNLRLHPARLRCISSVTGGWLPDADATDPSYWLRQLQWTSAPEVALQSLAQDGLRVLLQVGPGTCPTHERDEADDIALHSIHSLPVFPAQESDLRAVAEALGRLYALGVTIDWSAYHQGREPHRTPLPSYPFERRRCWFADSAGARHEEPPSLDQPIHGPDRDRRADALDSATPGIPVESVNPHAPPPSCVEGVLVDLCQSLLDIDSIGVDDNVVALGADSLFTMQLSRQIGEVFGVRISPHHLFVEPTIASLAKKIRQSQPQVDRPVDRPEEIAKQTPEPNSRGVERYDRILSLVEQLSDAEVEDILRRMID